MDPGMAIGWIEFWDRLKESGLAYLGCFLSGMAVTYWMTAKFEMNSSARLRQTLKLLGSASIVRRESQNRSKSEREETSEE